MWRRRDGDAAHDAALRATGYARASDDGEDASRAGDAAGGRTDARAASEDVKTRRRWWRRRESTDARRDARRRPSRARERCPRRRWTC